MRERHGHCISSLDDIPSAAYDETGFNLVVETVVSSAAPDAMYASSEDRAEQHLPKQELVGAVGKRLGHVSAGVYFLEYFMRCPVSPCAVPTDVEGRDPKVLVASSRLDCLHGVPVTLLRDVWACIVAWGLQGLPCGRHPRSHTLSVYEAGHSTKSEP